MLQRMLTCLQCFKFDYIYYEKIPQFPFINIPQGFPYWGHGGIPPPRTYRKFAHPPHLENSRFAWSKLLLLRFPPPGKKIPSKFFDLPPTGRISP